MEVPVGGACTPGSWGPWLPLSLGLVTYCAQLGGPAGECSGVMATAEEGANLPALLQALH